MKIRAYSAIDDETRLFDMMREEGTDWECYWGESVMDKYREALANSITYVVYESNELCGYVRCRDDDGLGVYIYDLLVRKIHRGKSLGKKLLERVCMDYPQDVVYAMSGVDEYYEKQGYCREGSIFKIDVQ